VLFRFVCTDADLDRLNEEIRSVLLHGGRAVIGRTRLDGRVFLKLTLMNPGATPDDVRELIGLVATTGLALSYRARAAA
jgi:L-2,4-diaminobutyrate decarboxylase